MGKSKGGKKPKKGQKSKAKGKKKDSLIDKLKRQVKNLTRQLREVAKDPDREETPEPKRTPQLPAERRERRLLEPTLLDRAGDDALTRAVTLATTNLPDVEEISDGDDWAVITGERFDRGLFEVGKTQKGFHRLGSPVLDQDPDNPDRQICWYAVGVIDDMVYLEGARVDDAEAFAKQFVAPKRVMGADTVDPSAISAAGASSKGRGVGAVTRSEALPAMPADAEPVFRPPVRHEGFGKLGVQELTAFAILQEWGMFSHPVYVQIRQAMVGWMPSSADGLYPAGSSGMPY